MYFGNLPVCLRTGQNHRIPVGRRLYGSSAPSGSQRVVGTRHIGENMNTKILIAALAGLALVAAAQSPTDKQKTKPSTMQTQHKDVAAGQVSTGKAAQYHSNQTAAKPAPRCTTDPTPLAAGRG